MDGGNGNDTYYVDDVSDTLIGGAGADSLWGGTGNDIFLFTSYGAGGDMGVEEGSRDLITDFETPGAGVGDKISFAQIDADPNAAGDQAFNFVAAGGAFSATNGEIRVVANGAYSYLVEGHIAGDTDTVFRVEIEAALDLRSLMTAHDFLL
jgi:Ca2+-binding RTX toxin-like protein